MPEGEESHTWSQTHQNSINSRVQKVTAAKMKPWLYHVALSNYFQQRAAFRAAAEQMEREGKRRKSSHTLYLERGFELKWPRGNHIRKMELSGSRHNRQASALIPRKKGEGKRTGQPPMVVFSHPRSRGSRVTDWAFQNRDLSCPPLQTIKSCFRFPNAFKRNLFRETCSLKSYSSTFPTLARQRGTREFCYQKIITSPGHYQA